MTKIEQLNIVGKRSGKGFVAHKAQLVNALARALSERVTLLDLNIGRKGLLGYLKALGGSNIVKVIPSNGDASGSQVADNGLKVICGSNTSMLYDGFWIGDNTPMTLCNVRVSPNNSVKPNIGAGELAEALARVLPFTARDDARPVLQCVNFVAGDGKLTLVSADGFRLAIMSLDCSEIEGQALINASDLYGVVNALKRAKRARVSIEPSGESLDNMSLVIDTEAIRYKWASVEGKYPDYEKLIPGEFNAFAHLDTIEAIRAVNSLKALSSDKAYPIDLTIGEGKIVMADPYNRGQAELIADTDGQGQIRLDGQYLAEALRACGGIADFNLVNAHSPMLFTTDGFQLVVMPMLVAEAQAEQEPETEAEQEPEVIEPEVIEPEAQAEPVSEPEPKKRNRSKVAVAVA